MAGPSGLTTEAFISKVRMEPTESLRHRGEDTKERGIAFEQGVRRDKMKQSDLEETIRCTLSLPHLCCSVAPIPPPDPFFFIFLISILFILMIQVAWRLGRYVAAEVDEVAPRDLLMPSLKFRRNCEYCHLSLFLSISLSHMHTSTHTDSIKCIHTQHTLTHSYSPVTRPRLSPLRHLSLNALVPHF